MTLDESALLLELEDVYWTEEGVLSLQITPRPPSRCWARSRSRCGWLRRGEEIVLVDRAAAPA